MSEPPALAGGQLDRVARIAEVQEVHALDDTAGVNVQAGDNPFGKHGIRDRLSMGPENFDINQGMDTGPPG